MLVAVWGGIEERVEEGRADELPLDADELEVVGTDGGTLGREELAERVVLLAEVVVVVTLSIPNENSWQIPENSG